MVQRRRTYMSSSMMPRNSLICGPRSTHRRRGMTRRRLPGLSAAALALTLVTVAFGGVGWASIANPGVTGFIDVVNKQPRFNAVGGVCEGGTDHGAICTIGTGVKADGTGVCSAGAAA